MSRVILNDHPFTEDEVEYLISRGRQSDVDQNAIDFPDGTEPPVPVTHTLELDPDIFEYVKGLELDQLKSDLLKRNLPIAGSEKELKGRLAQQLQVERVQGK